MKGSVTPSQDAIKSQSGCWDLFFRTEFVMFPQIYWEGGRGKPTQTMPFKKASIAQVLAIWNHHGSKQNQQENKRKRSEKKRNKSYKKTFPYTLLSMKKIPIPTKTEKGNFSQYLGQLKSKHLEDIHTLRISKPWCFTYLEIPRKVHWVNPNNASIFWADPRPSNRHIADFTRGNTGFWRLMASIQCMDTLPLWCKKKKGRGSVRNVLRVVDFCCWKQVWD